MPRVSEEHLERRRRQILDAARTCFIRKGVHETSMQDIFAESGLSAGAVYRYFRSKSEIIEANLSTTVGDLHGFLTDLMKREPLIPLDELVEQLANRLTELAEEGSLQLAPQSWALALHDPVLARQFTGFFLNVRDVWAVYLERLVQAGKLPADTDVPATAKTLFSLLPGFTVQRLLLKDFTAAELKRGIQALTAYQAPTPQD